jgi:hypothetical protein
VRTHGYSTGNAHTCIHYMYYAIVRGQKLCSRHRDRSFTTPAAQAITMPAAQAFTMPVIHDPFEREDTTFCMCCAANRGSAMMWVSLIGSYGSSLHVPTYCMGRTGATLRSLILHGCVLQTKPVRIPVLAFQTSWSSDSLA